MALLETLATQFAKVRGTNQTSTSYVDKTPTTTEPTGDALTATGASIIELTGGPGAQGVAAQNGILLCPYGVGADNTTGKMRVIGWRRIKGVTRSTNDLWVPVLLADLAFTLSAAYPGIAGAAVVATELFADTMTITIGNANVSVEVLSPGTTTADSGIAHALVDLKGFQKVEITLNTNSSATSVNALYALL